jgi:hypothetical protein
MSSVQTLLDSAGVILNRIMILKKEECRELLGDADLFFQLVSVARTHVRDAKKMIIESKGEK